jgi:hypothetical protein
MEYELFEKRILFESLSQIMSNQQEIKQHLGLIRYYGDDYYTKEMIDQCNAIVDRIRWEEINKD